MQSLFTVTYYVIFGACVCVCAHEEAYARAGGRFCLFSAYITAHRLPVYLPDALTDADGQTLKVFLAFSLSVCEMTQSDNKKLLAASLFALP